MANNDWAARAQQFLNAEARTAKAARTEAELRVAIMDTHATLEAVLRGYLTEEYALEGLGNKSEWNFPATLDLLREKTGNNVVDADTAQKIIKFNSLRNRVAHERFVPSVAEVQAGVSVTSGVMHRLLMGSQTAPAWQTPFYSLAGSLVRSLGSDLSFGLAGLMIIFAILYTINPIDLPGPLDDGVVLGTCVLPALLLIQAARALKKK